MQRAVAISAEDWLHNPSLKDQIVAAMTEAEEQSRLMSNKLDAVLRENTAYNPYSAAKCLLFPLCQCFLTKIFSLV